MDIHLLSVPYDTALRGARMGAGPERLLRAGAADRLRAKGHDVRLVDVALRPEAFPAEIRSAFELQRVVAERVAEAASTGALSIVLAGNCNTAALGTLGGLGSRGVGMLWFDSHGDFNTPETTIGGFLDGMALAMATGQCWRELVSQLPSFEPVPPANVLLLGARDLDPLEATLLAERGVGVLSAAEVRAGLAPRLEQLRERVRDVYVHVDVDVLDPVTHGRANALAAPGGLRVAEVQAALELTARTFCIRGAAVTAYDPSFDEDGRVCSAALALLESIADAAASSRAAR
jgi:arginase